MRFELLPGHRFDTVGVEPLIDGVDFGGLIADKAFGAEARVIEPLQQAGRMVVIPPKANRKEPRPYDRDLYKARHLIENGSYRLPGW